MFTKIAAWWNYSRIIFLQVVGFLVLIINELLPMLMGFDFEAFFTHEISVMIILGIQVATAVLRLNTFAPVGATAEDKEALSSVINSSVITGSSGRDYDVGDNIKQVDEPSQRSPKAE